MGVCHVYTAVYSLVGKITALLFLVVFTTTPTTFRASSHVFLAGHYGSDNGSDDDSDMTQTSTPFPLVPLCHIVTGPSVSAGVAGAHGAQGYCSRRHAVGGEPDPHAFCGKKVLKTEAI